MANPVWEIGVEDQILPPLNLEDICLEAWLLTQESRKHILGTNIVHFRNFCERFQVFWFDHPIATESLTRPQHACGTERRG